MNWTKERIHALLDSNPRAVLKACLAIYARQTSDEQVAKTTSKSNGVGFGAFDAEFCSDIAQRALKAERRGWQYNLSSRQLAILRNKMKRYHRQLCEIANAKEQTAVESVAIPVGGEVSAKDLHNEDLYCADGSPDESAEEDRMIAAAELAHMARTGNYM